MLRALRLALILAICSSCKPSLAGPTEISQLAEQVRIARQQGDMDNADQLASRYLALAHQQQDPLEQGKAYFSLGRNAMERNHYPEANTHLRQAISLFQNAGEPKLLADAYRQLGLTFRYQSDYSQALHYLYQAMQIYQQLQDNSAIASAYNSIGTTLEKTGQLEAALLAHQKALELNYQLANQSGIASAIYNLGDLNRVLGDIPKALKYFTQSLELDIASGDKRNMAYSHNKLGYIYLEQGEFGRSAEHLNQALLLFEQIQARRDIDWARVNLAKLAMRQGKFDQAQLELDGVIARASMYQYKNLLVMACTLGAELAVSKGDLAAALSYIDKGVAQARLNNERADEAKLEALRVAVLIKQDAVRDALAALQRQKQLEDDIFNAKRVATIATIQTDVEFSRQQHQLALLTKEHSLQQAIVEQQRLTRNFWIFGLLGSFALLLMLYHRYNQQRQNQRLSKQVALRTAELNQKNQELQQAYQTLETISLTDKLTGLHNRHFLESHIENDLEHSWRLHTDWKSGKIAEPENADIVVFLIDLDNFKVLNDSYGHNIGDEILKLLKTRMQMVFRHADYLVRWGGEEFVAVARFISHADAANLAQRFIETINQTPFNIEGQPPLSVSCSVGYACYPLPLQDTSQHWSTLLKLADLCLYAAKYSGRNGWVGVEQYHTEFALPVSMPDAEHMERWQAEGIIDIRHSFAGTLNWQQPADS